MIQRILAATANVFDFHLICKRPIRICYKIMATFDEQSGKNPLLNNNSNTDENLESFGVGGKGSADETNSFVSSVCSIETGQIGNCQNASELQEMREMKETTSKLSELGLHEWHGESSNRLYKEVTTGGDGKV